MQDRRARKCANTITANAGMPQGPFGFDKLDRDFLLAELRQILFELQETNNRSVMRRAGLSESLSRIGPSIATLVQFTGFTF